MAVHAADPDLSWLYRDTRERLVLLLSELDGAALATRVPACPAWSVREVLPVIQGERGGVIAGERVRDVNGPAWRSRAGPGGQGVAGVLSLSR